MAHIRKSGLLGGHNVTSGSDSYTFPDLPPAGRLLIARFSSWRGGGGAGAFTVTDNKGSTWTVNQYTFADVGIDNRRIGIAYLRVPSGWTGTYTVTISTTLGTSSFSATISEYSEMVTSGDPLDQIARAYGTLSASLTVTSGATSQATELVCTALDLEYWADTDANIVAPSGYTMRDVNDDWNAGTVFGSADKDVSATGVQAPVWTFDSAILLIGLVATFKKAVSGSTPTNEISGGGNITFGDTYSPVVSYSSAPPSTASSGTTHTITASAIDDLGIASFVLQKNGTTVATSSVSTVSYNWTVTTETGSVSWRAVAVDTAANETVAFATTTISNDTTVPTITLSASDTDIAAVSEQSTLTAIASDNTAIANVKFYSGAPGSGTLLSTVTSAPYRHVLSFSRADNGSQTFYATATDTAGNAVNSAVVTIAVAIPDVLSLAVMSVVDVQAPAGDSIGWSLLLTQNGVPLSGVSVAASSSEAWFDLDSATDETDQNGVAVFTGTIDPEAENGDAATITFTYSTASASATVTVNDGPSNWLTIVRNSTVWVRIPRDTLE